MQPRIVSETGDRAQASRGEQRFKKLILSPSRLKVYWRSDVAIVLTRRWKGGISLNGIVNQRRNELHGLMSRRKCSRGAEKLNKN